MNRHFRFVRNVTWLLCAFFLFPGCGKEEPPPKPKVITKKIITEKKVAAQSPAADAKAPATAVPKPPEKPPAAKPSDAKPSDARTTVAEKPAKPPEKAEKPSEKPPDKAVAKSEGAAPKPSEKKADVVIPDVSALEKEVEKAVAAFDSKGRIDPFVPLFKEEPKPKVETITAKRKGGIVTPLEKVEISQLKLVGIVRGAGPPKALVEEATGKGYIIRKGTLIGINSGKVSEIGEDKVVIDEEFEETVGNELDGWDRRITVRKREMKIQRSLGDDL
jgi:Tfp pilus assembly protein PilP